MFVLVGAVGIYLLRKHRGHARRFILSFLKVEALLTFKVAVELWDICVRALRACLATRSQAL
jgi:hypothetical protein